MRKLAKRDRFREKVLSKFEVYNSVFSTLPYDSIKNTGVLLSLFKRICDEGYKNNLNPSEIVENFFNLYLNDKKEKFRIDLLFNFIKYIERQIVLFDAVEDAAFSEINNLDGIGTMRSLKEEVESKNKKKELKKNLFHFKVRPVLTAHPTQFYPGSVLGIITDLTKAVKKNDLNEIKSLLSQLGKTPFFKNKKPTPFDEAVSLTWYLENVFYQSISNIYKYIKTNIFNGDNFPTDLINLGFWPGGDRDGNPNVTTKTTIKTAKKLRSDIIKNYYRDVKKLRRRLTFKNVESEIIEIENKLYKSILDSSQEPFIKLNDFKNRLSLIRQIIIKQHKSLFLDELDDLINKVNIFGYHFATLDIRQDSRIHSKAFNEIIKILSLNKSISNDVLYDEMDINQKLIFLSKLKGDLSPNSIKNNLLKSTLESIRSMKIIQKSNGERGSNRYIISNNQTAVNILEVFAMFRLSNWSNPTVDIVPLFETVSDLENANSVMTAVYQNKTYRNHLKNRNNEQTIMLGFSDGTKDGGYFMANWSILKAKESLTSISRKFGIKVVFLMEEEVHPQEEEEILTSFMLHWEIL